VFVVAIILLSHSSFAFDIMQGLQAYGNTFCESGGGLKYWATGPEYSSTSGYPCQCNEIAGGNWTWCNYPYMCAGYFVQTSGLYYYNIVETSQTPFIFTEYFDNNSTEEDTIIFTRTESTSATYTWQFTDSFTVGYQLSITAGIPGICETHDQFSMSLNLGETITQQGTNTQQWEVSQTIGVPPESTVRVDVVVAQAKFNCDYTNAITLDPFSFGDIWCNDQVNSHYEWFIPPEDFLLGNFGNDVYCYGGACNITGSFTGVQGVSVFVNVTQCPLYVHC